MCDFFFWSTDKKDKIDTDDDGWVNLFSWMNETRWKGGIFLFCASLSLKLLVLKMVEEAGKKYRAAQ